MSNYLIPSQLTGEMATLWQNLKLMAGSNPEAAVSVTDQTMFAGVQALSACGGCTFEKVSETEYSVNLLFAVEETSESLPEIEAVAKPHKFAG